MPFYATLRSSRCLKESLRCFLACRLCHGERDKRHRMSPHKKRSDAVAQSPSLEIGVPDLPSLKAKKRRNLPREKVLLEP